MAINPPKKLFLVFITALVLVGFVALKDHEVFAADEWVTPPSVAACCGAESGSPCSKMLDGDIYSEWRHYQDELHYIDFDLGAQKTVKKIRLYSFGFGAYKWLAFEAYVSADGSNWGAPVGLGLSATANGWNEIDITDKDGRYIKIENIVPDASNHYLKGTEMQAYVSAASVASGPTFSLSPPSGSTVSGTFDVTLNLTDLDGKAVSGIDAYLNYEPSKLEAQSINVSGGIFANYPLQTIDPARGIIAINAAAPAYTPVTTDGKIATITFKTLGTSGSTTLDFDYTAGSTIDSNIVEAGTGTDILTQPPTVTYNFESAGPFTFWLVPVWNRVVWLAQFTTPRTSYSVLSHIETFNGGVCAGSPQAIARKKNGWWESAVLGYGGVTFDLAANNNYYIKVGSACQWQPEL